MADEVAVSIKESARRLGVGHDAVYALIADGRLRSFRIGQRHLIAVAELQSFVERQTRIQNVQAIGPRAATR